ncbi:hypothetical protein [Cryobacterium sp. Sr8]|nr:hypothetical protein [Cryobacterium sp. Sr8]
MVENLLETLAQVWHAVEYGLIPMAVLLGILWVVSGAKIFGG